MVRRLRGEISELKLTLSGKKLNVVHNADEQVQANSGRIDQADSDSKKGKYSLIQLDYNRSFKGAE